MMGIAWLRNYFSFLFLALMAKIVNEAPGGLLFHWRLLDSPVPQQVGEPAKRTQASTDEITQILGKAGVMAKKAVERVNVVLSSFNSGKMAKVCGRGMGGWVLGAGAVSHVT